MNDFYDYHEQENQEVNASQMDISSTIDEKTLSVVS